MSRDVILAAGRAAAEEGMTDACVVIERVAPGEWDEETNDYGPAEEVFSYEGPCKIKADGTQPALTESAGRPVVTIEPEIHFPVLTSGDIKTGQVVRVTDARYDPALIGREFIISGLSAASQATARRLRVKEES